MEINLLHRWFDAGMPRDSYPEIPLDADELTQFASEFAKIVLNLDREQLEILSVIVPGIMAGVADFEEFVKHLDALDLSVVPDINRLLIGEIAVSIYITNEIWEKCSSRIEPLVKLAIELDEKEELTIILNDLGVCQYRQAMYLQARDSLNESLRIADEIGSDKRRARARINLGLVYKEIGQLDEAAGHYKVALKLARDIGDERTLLACYLNIGNIYKELKRWDEGLNALKKGIELAGEIGDERERNRGELNMGVLLLDMGNPAGAVDIFRSVRESAAKKNADLLELIAGINLAYALVKLDSSEDSLEISRENLAQAERLEDVEGIWRTYANMARAMSQLERITEAETYFVKGLEEFERLRGELKSNRDRIEFQRNLRHLHNELIEFALGKQNPEIAYARLASAKSRTLVISSKNAALKELRWEDVRNVLKEMPGTMLLDYFIYEGKVSVFVCDDESVRVHEIKESENEITELICEYNADIGLFIVSREFREAHRDMKTNAPTYLVELGSILLSPVRDILDNYKHIIFIPHTIIHNLPYSVLINPSNNRGEYLFFSHSISVMPSGEYFVKQAELRRDDVVKGSEKVVVIKGGDDGLDSLVDEISAIKDVYGENVQVTDFEGSMDLSEVKFLKKLAMEARVIHFSGHAEFDHSDPYSSALLFGNGKRLTALEIMESDMDLSRVELVTLAGCETAMGEVKSGDEVISLARAFMSRGAGSVMVSLWKIDDKSSSALIGEFYKGWESGLSIPEALKVAQISMYHTGKAHPYFFGPFIVMG